MAILFVKALPPSTFISFCKYPTVLNQRDKTRGVALPLARSSNEFRGVPFPLAKMTFQSCTIICVDAGPISFITQISLQNLLPLSRHREITCSQKLI